MYELWGKKMKLISRPICLKCYGVYIQQDPPQIRDPSTGERIYESDARDDAKPVFSCVDCGSHDIFFDSE